MATVKIKMYDKKDSEIGLIIEFNPQIDGDADEDSLTPAQQLAMAAMRAIAERFEESED